MVGSRKEQRKKKKQVQKVSRKENEKCRKLAGRKKKVQKVSRKEK